MAVEVQQDAADAWFRRNGLPLVVQRSRQGQHLLARSIGIQLFAILAGLPFYGLHVVVLVAPDEPAAADVASPVLIAVVVLVFIAVAVGLPVLLAWLAVRALRARSERFQVVVAVVVSIVDVVVGTVALPALLFTGEPAPGPPPLWWAVSVAGVLMTLVLIRFGVGAILLWALRRALRQISRIGTMAARVLPLLILVVIFIFFTGELWQVLNRLSRAQMWAVVGFLALIAVGFITATFSDELPGLRARSRTGTEVRARVADTPLAGATDAAVPRLSLPERVNVVLVLFVAQAMQIVVFTVLMFVFFVVFGALVITPDGQAALLGDQTSPPGTLFGIPIGLSNAMLHVSLFLAAFSGLSFAASTTAEEPYRGTFFNPLLDEVALSLAARDAYKAAWPVP